MKIVFMGTPDFAVPILEAINEHYGVDLVVTQPDKRVGRNQSLQKPPVKEIAEKHSIPVFQPRNIKTNYDTIVNLRPTLIITAAYGQIIPREVLFAPPLGAINVHGSLLPKLRGGAPIQRAIMRNHHKTGVTIMYMAMAMDSGDIIAQRSISIKDKDTTGDLFNKLSILGRDLLLDTLPSIIDGTANRIKQDEDKVTFAYNLKKYEERLDLSRSKTLIDCQLRAFLPEPGCYVMVDNKRLKIYQMRITEAPLDPSHQDLDNGTVVAIEKRYFRIKVKDGYLDVYEVQLEGKKKMPTIQFLNGAGRKLIALRKVFH
ncbi:MAG: methionyl-tRNA formyltransferase [Candidatus Izimaplasma sp.]|nr:methionyl-tRNA formyltransferase [Candidatus Izimaplasma bacterium]